MSRALATLLLSLLIVGASAAQTATDPFAPLSNPAAWTPDRVCRVTAEAGELVWDFEADKTVSGAIAIRAEGLSLPKPEILSFQVLTPDVGYLLVTFIYLKAMKLHWILLVSFLAAYAITFAFRDLFRIPMP